MLKIFNSVVTMDKLIATNANKDYLRVFEPDTFIKIKKTRTRNIQKADLVIDYLKSEDLRFCSRDLFFRHTAYCD